jgi:hypothetical protein
VNFETGDDFYEWLASANSAELHEFMLEHSECFTEDLCEEEDDLLADDEIDELYVCEVARAKSVSEESLRHLWSLDTDNDGDRYVQKCWALLESPNLTAALLNEIDPYGPLMIHAMTSHSLADAKLVKKIFNQGLISLDETIDYLVSEDILTEGELDEYKKNIQSKLSA